MAKLCQRYNYKIGSKIYWIIDTKIYWSIDTKTDHVRVINNRLIIVVVGVQLVFREHADCKTGPDLK